MSEDVSFLDSLMTARRAPAPSAPFVREKPTVRRPGSGVGGAATTSKVTARGADVVSAYVESAAFVAVTMHVPALVARNTLSLTAHPVAVPSVTLKLTAPVPEPPLTASATGWLSVLVATAVTVRVACCNGDVVGALGGVTSLSPWMVQSSGEEVSVFRAAAPAAS